MERCSDMYISTLSKIIEAMGGELQIVANMPNGRGVQIHSLRRFVEEKSRMVPHGAPRKAADSRNEK